MSPLVLTGSGTSGDEWIPSVGMETTPEWQSLHDTWTSAETGCAEPVVCGS